MNQKQKSSYELIIYKRTNLFATVKIINWVKKVKFQDVKTQRNHGQVIKITPVVKKLNRKLTLLFHSFSQIKKNADNLFCTGDIKNIDEAIDVYQNYNKKNSTWMASLCMYWYFKKIT